MAGELAVVDGEEWRPVKNQIFGEGYIVSNRGRVAKVMTGSFTTNGYHTVSLSSRRKVKMALVHVLVADAFKGRPDGEHVVVHHRDNNKKHNHISNLEYSTRGENTRQAFRDGVIKIGEDHHSAKLGADQVQEVRKLLEAGKSQREIAAKFGVSPTTISHIKLGKIWVKNPEWRTIQCRKKNLTQR